MRVPGAPWDEACREEGRVGDGPDDQHRVGEGDEGRSALDGGLLAGRGVGEAEQLLEVTEADLDGPALAVALEDGGCPSRIERVTMQRKSCGVGMSLLRVAASSNPAFERDAAKARRPSTLRWASLAPDRSTINLLSTN